MTFIIVSIKIYMCTNVDYWGKKRKTSLRGFCKTIESSIKAWKKTFMVNDGPYFVRSNDSARFNNSRELISDE